jgi:DNA-binding response OmpR family regulator
MDDTATPSRLPYILVVEDEPLIRMMAVEMLDALGYGALEAGSGADALAMVMDRRIATLMIDLGLPDQPGEGVIRQILQLRPGLPIIVTTGADTVAARQRLTDCGPLSFLGKPYYFKELERTLAAFATSGQTVS